MMQEKGSRLLHACFNMRKQLNRLINSGQLTPGEYLVLRHLWRSYADGARGEQQGNVKAADLSELLDLSRPSITRILNDLERRELIKRSIDTNDRRSINIELTEVGMAALERANGRIREIAARLVAALGDADVDKLLELMDKMTETYKEMLAESGGIE